MLSSSRTYTTFQHVLRSKKQGRSLSRFGIVCSMVGLMLSAPSILFSQVEVEGQWDGPCDSGEQSFVPQSIHAVLTHTGYVVTWKWRFLDANAALKIYAWNVSGTGAYDPCTHEFFNFEHPPDHAGWSGPCDPGPNTCSWDESVRTTIFCAGHTFLPDGNLFVRSVSIKVRQFSTTIRLLSAPDPAC